MTPERLTSLDASFLYLETPAVHMHVAGISVFDPRDDGLTYDDVQRVVEARLHLAPRLRQSDACRSGSRVRCGSTTIDSTSIFTCGGPRSRPRAGGSSSSVPSDACSRPLDPAKPLWELYVFEGLAERRTAVLLKMHHALADGISGMTIASALFDLAPDAEIGTPPTTQWTAAPPPTRDELLRDAAHDLVLHPLEAIGHARGPRPGRWPSWPRPSRGFAMWSIWVPRRRGPSTR